MSIHPYERPVERDVVSVSRSPRCADDDSRYQMWRTHVPHGSTLDSLSGASAEVHEKQSYCGDSISMYTHTGAH